MLNVARFLAGRAPLQDNPRPEGVTTMMGLTRKRVQESDGAWFGAVALRLARDVLADVEAQGLLDSDRPQLVLDLARDLIEGSLHPRDLGASVRRIFTPAEVADGLQNAKFYGSGDTDVFIADWGLNVHWAQDIPFGPKSMMGVRQQAGYVVVGALSTGQRLAAWRLPSAASLLPVARQVRHQAKNAVNYYMRRGEPEAAAQARVFHTARQIPGAAAGASAGA